LRSDEDAERAAREAAAIGRKPGDYVVADAAHFVTTGTITVR